MALYYLVPRFPTATFDLGSRLGAINSECIVPENIHTAPPSPPPDGNSEVGGGVQKEAISEKVGEGGLSSREFFPGAPSIRSIGYKSLTAALLSKLSVILL